MSRKRAADGAIDIRDDAYDDDDLIDVALPNDRLHVIVDFACSMIRDICMCTLNSVRVLAMLTQRTVVMVPLNSVHTEYSYALPASCRGSSRFAFDQASERFYISNRMTPNIFVLDIGNKVPWSVLRLIKDALLPVHDTLLAWDAYYRRLVVSRLYAHDFHDFRYVDPVTGTETPRARTSYDEPTEQPYFYKMRAICVTNQGLVCVVDASRIIVYDPAVPSLKLLRHIVERGPLPPYCLVSGQTDEIVFLRTDNVLEKIGSTEFVQTSISLPFHQLPKSLCLRETSTMRIALDFATGLMCVAHRFHIVFRKPKDMPSRRVTPPSLRTFCAHEVSCLYTFDEIRHIVTLPVELRKLVAAAKQLNMPEQPDPADLLGYLYD